MGLRKRLVALLVVGGVTAALCTNASAQSSSTTTTVPAGNVVVKNGGTVTVGVSHLPTNFNPSAPAGENSVTNMVMSQVWPQPFVVNGDLQATPALDSHGGPGFLGPSGAELVSVHPETVVYNINPKAKWSDGVPITVSDFIYNWHQQLLIGDHLSASDPLLGYKAIKSIKGSDKGKTVTVVFAKTYADWEALFANLVPEHIGVQAGWIGSFAGFHPDRVISGGPFIITKYVAGKELELSRNPHYWGAPPQLTHIVFAVKRTSMDNVHALTSGKIGVAQLSPGPAVSDLANNPALSLHSALSTTLWQIVFNLASPAVSSVNVRQGIASAIDRSQLISNTIGFLTPFNATSGNRVYASGAPGSEGNDSAYSHVNLTTATALFSAVGDNLGPDGRLHDANGAPIVYTLVGPLHAPVMSAVEAQLSAQLLQAGITLKVHNIPMADLLHNVLPTGSYEIALAPYAASPFPSTSEALYTSPVGPTPIATSFVPTPTTTPTTPAPPTQPLSTAVTGNEREPNAVSFGAVTRDINGFSDPAVSALYEQATAELNASSAAGIYNHIDSLLWDDMPTLPLFQMPNVLVSKGPLVNIRATQSLTGALWDAQDWAIELNWAPTTTTLP